MEWFRIPERFLATVTSGEVFDDHQGTFSQIRSTLKGFYPEDVLKKKLAARCAVMAQAGQYKDVYKRQKLYNGSKMQRLQ